MSLLKKATSSRKKGYMWGCGLRPHPHIYRSPSRFWAFLSAFKLFTVEIYLDLSLQEEFATDNEHGIIFIHARIAGSRFHRQILT